MTSLVVDASAAFTLLGTAGAHTAVRRSTMYAPALVDLEFASVVRKQLRLERLTAHSAAGLIAAWASNGVIRCPHTRYLPRIWQFRNNITPYDAAYVALAEHLGIPLVTADQRLAVSAAKYCDVMTV